MKKTGNGNGRNTGLVRPGVRSVDSSSGSSRASSGNKPSTIKNNKTSASSTRSASKSSSSSKGKTSSKRTVSKKKKNKAAPIFAAVIAVVVLGIAAGVLYKLGYFEKRYDITMADGTVVKMTQSELVADMTQGVFPQGIVINGIDVGGMTKEEALAAVKANQPERPIDINVDLSLDGTNYPLDLSSLPIETNDEAVVEEAFNHLRPTGEETIEQLVALHDSREALKSTPAEFQTAYTLNTDDIAPLVHDVLDPLNSIAVEAEITGFDVEELQFEYTDSEQGYEIDIDSAVNDVKALLDGGTYEGTVPVTAEITVPTLTTEMLEEEFGLISTSSSSLGNSSSSRINNISTAADTLNGFILQPDEEFSFNGVIGERTAANGYQEAGVIVDGATEQGYGGGVCQVSSMIYQSAIKANLNITERHPHQWPSSYAVCGTDAAVDWGVQDLKFVNDSGFPLAFAAHYDSETNEIIVEIYGHMLPDGQYIEFEGEEVSRSSAGTTYVQNTSLPVGQTVQTRAPHDGVTANSYQIWYDADGNEINRVELDPTRYGTINRVVEVGTLQPDGSQAAFNGADGSITTSETTTEETTTEATVEETTAAPTETQAPAPTEPATTESQTPPPENTGDSAAE